jgi:hypothetical protein
MHYCVRWHGWTRRCATVATPDGQYTAEHDRQAQVGGIAADMATTTPHECRAFSKRLRKKVAQTRRKHDGAS